MAQKLIDQQSEAIPPSSPKSLIVLHPPSFQEKVGDRDQQIANQIDEIREGIGEILIPEIPYAIQDPTHNPLWEKLHLQKKFRKVFRWVEKNLPAENHQEMSQLLQEFFIEALGFSGDDFLALDICAEVILNLRPLYRHDYQKFTVVFQTLDELLKIQGAPACQMVMSMWLALGEKQTDGLGKFVIIADYFSRTLTYSRRFLETYIQKYEQHGKEAAHIYLEYALFMTRRS
jgi:hypothetical protein